VQQYFIAGIACIVAVELFLALPFWPAIQNLAHYARRTNRVIASNRISDHWKEKVLLRYSAIIATNSIKIALWLLLLFGLVALVILSLDWLFTSPIATLEWLATVKGATIATVFSVFYYWARSRLVNAVRMTR
jgi:hypothetical protein